MSDEKIALDEVFLAIIKDLAQSAIMLTTQTAASIVDTTESYLSTEERNQTKNLLEEFKKSLENDNQTKIEIDSIKENIQKISASKTSLFKKILPIFSSLHFEDNTRHKLDHIVFGYNKIISALNTPNANFQEISEEIKNNLSSKDETILYFDMVLNEPIPSDYFIENKVTFLRNET